MVHNVVGTTIRSALISHDLARLRMKGNAVELTAQLSKARVVEPVSLLLLLTEETTDLLLDILRTRRHATDYAFCETASHCADIRNELRLRGSA